MAEKFLELEFTILQFFDQHVVSQPREGVVLEAKQIKDLISVCSHHYKGRDFVYISQRSNDYNVDPTIYRMLDNVDNLAGIAIVSEKVSSLNMARFEKTFCKVPFEIFMKMEEALQWSRDLLEKK